MLKQQNFFLIGAVFPTHFSMIILFVYHTSNGQPKVYIKHICIKLKSIFKDLYFKHVYSNVNEMANKNKSKYLNGYTWSLKNN